MDLIGAVIAGGMVMVGILLAVGLIMAQPWIMIILMAVGVNVVLWNKHH